MQREKIKAKVLGCGDLRVECPKCKQRHLFTMSGYDTCILNTQEDDSFQIVAGNPGDPAILHPDFVCRNLKCDHVATVTIEVESMK